MSSIGIKIEGLDAILTNIDKSNAQLANGIDRIVQGAGIRCQALAKQACPVDTGRLRNSILYHNIGKNYCTVDTNVNYAVFVEMGTRRMSSRPFLYPAYIKAKQEMMDKLRAV